jgi:hypothetical protein
MCRDVKSGLGMTSFQICKDRLPKPDFTQRRKSDFTLPQEFEPTFKKLQTFLKPDPLRLGL